MGVTTEGKEGQEQSIICIGCARPMPAETDFCPHCGAPNGPYCWYDPWKRIFASGHVYRRMTSGPVTQFVAVAVLLFLVGMIAALFFGAVEMSRESGSQAHGLLLPLLGTLAMLGVLLFFARRVILNYMKQRRDHYRTRDVSAGEDRR